MSLLNAAELHFQWQREVYREKGACLMGIEMQFHRYSWNSYSNNITLQLANLFV